MVTKSKKKGRKSREVEFLQTLIEWSGGRPEFCKRTGLKQGNVSYYLQGKKPLAMKRLKTAARSVLGADPPAFVPILEMHPLRNSHPTKAELTDAAGVYAFFDSSHHLVYVGKATKMYGEVRQTLHRIVKVHHAGKKQKTTFGDVAAFVSAYRILRSDKAFRHDLEALLLRLIISDTQNQNLGRFKRRS